jgi:hypothetical protein
MDEYADIFLNTSAHSSRDSNGVMQPPVGDISSRVQLRKDLKCKSFDWYMKTVATYMYAPLEGNFHHFGRSVTFAAWTLVPLEFLLLICLPSVVASAATRSGDLLYSHGLPWQLRLRLRLNMQLVIFFEARGLCQVAHFSEPPLCRGSKVCRSIKPQNFNLWIILNQTIFRTYDAYTHTLAPTRHATPRLRSLHKNECVYHEGNPDGKRCVRPTLCCKQGLSWR